MKGEKGRVKGDKDGLKDDNGRSKDNKSSELNIKPGMCTELNLTCWERWKILDYTYLFLAHIHLYIALYSHVGYYTECMFIVKRGERSNAYMWWVGAVQGEESLFCSAHLACFVLQYSPNTWWMVGKANITQLNLRAIWT